MSLLAAVAAHLRAADVPFALIGASALAAHGVSRSTLDQDLLVTSRHVLAGDIWRTLSPATADVRVGDSTDPLAGVVRLSAPSECPADVFVGRGTWMSEVLARAVPVRLQDVELPIVTAADLVLLKLYAGGDRDLWDTRELLALPGAADLKRAVDRLLAACPDSMRDAWRRVVG